MVGVFCINWIYGNEDKAQLYATPTCSWGVMIPSYSTAKTSGPELSIDGASSSNFSMSCSAAWAPSLDCNVSTS